MRRWLGFAFFCLLALIAFGAWRAAERDYQAQIRGGESAARHAEMPPKLPLAGVNVELTQYDDPAAELEQIADLGFTWVRQPFLWSEIEPEQGVFEWSAYDAIMEAVAAQPDLKIIAVLDGSPPWARHRDAPDHPFAPPASPSDYGNFAREVAARYGDLIDHYQIWDEPNIRSHWGNRPPRPALYVAMMQAAYEAIHRADDEAMVIMAALAPTVETGLDNINDPAYLRAIYELGGRDYFDAAAGKPYGFDHPPYDRRVSLDLLNFSRLILLREEMLRQGDGHKPFWGSNFGWNALPDDWTSTPSIWGQVSATQQIDYTHSAYDRARDEWPWLGGLILQHWQPNAPPDDPIQGFTIAPRAESWREAIPNETEIMSNGFYPALTPYAHYSGDWTFGELGADAGANAPQNTIRFTFEGDELALKLRRDDYLAYLSVTIDGQPANALPRNRDGQAFIALTSADRQPSIDLIMVARNLGAGQHEAVITHRPELGDDRWPIVGFAVGNSPESRPFNVYFSLGLFLLGLIGIFVMIWRVSWAEIRLPSPASLRNMGDFALGLAFSLILWLGALITWQETLITTLRRDMPTLIAALGTSTLLYYAPSTWIALFGLLITGLIIFSRPWVGLLQILFWAAFFSSNLDPFFRAIALVEVMLALTLAATFARTLYDHAQTRQNIWRRLRDVKLHPLDYVMVALVGLGFLSLLWSEFIGLALREIRVMLIGPMLFYALIRFLRPNRRDLAFLVEAFLFTGFILALIGLISYFTETNIVVAEGGARRLTSVYGSPNSLGLMLGRCLPFALAYLLMPVGQWRRILAGITGATMLLALALSQSVGALLLGLPAAVSVILIAWRGRRAWPYLIALAAAGALAFIPLSALLPRLRQIFDPSSNTSVIRANLWRSTFEMLKDQPLTGVGMDQFLYAYRSRYILPAAWQDPDLSHPHNILLDYWVRLGLLGVILALALQAFFWRTALSAYRLTKGKDPLSHALILGAMGAMAGLLAHGLVDMAHFNINLSYALALLLALVVQIEQNAKAEGELEQKT